MHIPRISKKELIFFSWATLGSYRGNKKYSAERVYYNSKTPELYLDRFLWGVGGALIYTFPVFLPLTAYYELTKLEKLLRNIEEDD